MNHLTIEIEEGAYRRVHIFIDGESLIHKLKNYEQSFADAEGKPDNAGSYECQRFPAVDRPLLLAEQPEQSDDKFELLDCSCGNPGCWPLLVDITRDEDKILWHGFEQPYRSNPDNHWNYADFGQFVFDFEQYKGQIAKLFF